MTADANATSINADAGHATSIAVAAACATSPADAGHSTSINADAACATSIADAYAACATLIADAPAFASGTQQQSNLLLFCIWFNDSEACRCCNILTTVEPVVVIANVDNDSWTCRLLIVFEWILNTVFCFLLK